MEHKPFLWSNDRQKILIDFFKENEFLYNPIHPDYKKRRLRDKKILELCSTLGCSMLECKNKFHNLRTYFFREYNKVLKHNGTSCNGSGSGEETYTSKWDFYEDMKFLNVCYLPRTLEMAAGGENNHESTAETPSTDCNWEANSILEPDCLIDESAEVMEAEQDSSSVSEHRVQTPPHKRRKQQDPHLQASPTAAVTRSALDEEHYFGMYVAAALRTFDAVGRDTAKVKIMDLIMHLRHNVDPNHRK
ncbi:uncharacterized protein LOC144159354 [Haemaphysalis longicornis]